MGVAHKDSSRHHGALLLLTIKQPFSIKELMSLLPQFSEGAVKSMVTHFREEKYIKRNGYRKVDGYREAEFVVTEHGLKYAKQEKERDDDASTNQTDPTMPSMDFYENPENIKRAFKAMTVAMMKIIDDYNTLKKQLAKLAR